MILKITEKIKAIELRKSGKTYSEILKIVPVAKSTLSLWLREVGLSKVQKQTITKKRIDAAFRGAMVRKKQRIESSLKIFLESEKQIKKLSDREFWLIGTALYWAEGSKEKEYKPGSGMDFTNSDPKMVRFFVKWIEKTFKIDKSDLVFDIYIHKNYENEIDRFKRFWSKVLGIFDENLFRVYYKKHNFKTNRKNIGNVYNGSLRVRVRSSSSKVRQINGWVMGICNN
jgi:hypothetical protein